MDNALTAARDAKDLLSKSMDEDRADISKLKADLANTRNGRPQEEKDRLAELGRAQGVIRRAIPWMTDLPADEPVSLAEALDFALPLGERPTYGATKPSASPTSGDADRHRSASAAQQDEDRRRSASTTDDMLPVTVSIAAAVASSPSSSPSPCSSPDPSPSYDSASSSSFDAGGGGF